MRKSYLIFAGMLFIGVSAFAQSASGPDLNDPRNAKVIFHQDFEVKDGVSTEQAYEDWAKTPIDTIREIEYYSKIGTSSVSSKTDIYDGSADWEIFAVRRDSTSSAHTPVNPGDGIIMFNGVEQTSSQKEIDSAVYAKDVYMIVGDEGLDQERNEVFKGYGEDGGKYFFQYTTGGIQSSKISSSHYSTSTHSTKNYRRDLYVRGLDIEDTTSYRLTFYLKTKKLNSWSPLFYADLMRGYHHQRAAFSMGYTSGKDFSYSKDVFDDGQWEKITIMNYYINDHEADAYVFYKGDYSWSDDWTWRPSEDLWPAGKTLNEGEALNYVKQPDKFFIRLAFATDSVEYSLDNLSLTKSWIAGCEYDKDKMRVDFGYETNLAKLAKAAESESNIAAVEVPNTGYVVVWGLKDNDTWESVPIASIEYHGDGYMYMFTPTITLPNGNVQKVLFKQYKQVLVSFKNPTDQEGLGLQYTGSLYPKAHDSIWIKAGKYVPDFYNEVATPNPYAFDGVFSMKELPPVVQTSPYEDGSFGLDGSVREFRFKFSRQVDIQEVEDLESSKRVIAYVGEEIWKPTWSSSDSCLVITRPDKYQGDLKGDYKIELVQIYGIGTSKGDDVVVNYHFGEFSKTVSLLQINSDWRGELPSFDTSDPGCNPASTYVRDSYPSSFRKGANSGSSRAKTRLYSLGYPEGDPDNCGYVIITRSSTSGNTANLFTVVHFDEPDECKIEFKATGWTDGTKLPGITGYLYFYPKPAGELTDGDDGGWAILNGVANKTMLGDGFTPSTFVTAADVEDVGTGKWPTGVETIKRTFTVPSAGDYVFEWVTKEGNKKGVMIGNFSISSANAGDLSSAYVKKINDVYDLADAKKKEIDAAARNYKGSDYEAFTAYMSTFKENAFKETAPSAYNANVAAMNNAIKAMQARMDTVDLYYTTQATANAELEGLKGDSVNLAAYVALDTHMKANEDLVMSDKTTAEISAEIKKYKAELETLDARLALMTDYQGMIKKTKSVIDGAIRKDYEEYTTMVAEYDAATKYNIIAPTDSALNIAYNTLLAAKNGYIFRYDYYMAKTKQIKDLFALADTLGFDFGGDKAGFKATVDALEDTDAHIDSLLREAAILQILKIYRDNDETTMAKYDSLDVSALIPNYYLYNEADIDRDMKKSGSGNWYIKRSANTKVIPGWTLTPNATSGYWYFTTAKVEDTYAMDSYTDWEVDGHVFIGGLRSATKTKGVLTTTVKGLPEGYYKVGMFAYNRTSDLAYQFKSDSADFSGKVIVDMNGGSKFSFMEVGIDSVLVAGDLIYTIDQKSSSSEEFDMRSAVLRLRGLDPTYDYAYAATEQEAKVAKLMTIVDAPAVEKAGVQYFNLGGMQVDTPKSGEILIRRTVRNGKIVVDKVLIK